MESAAALMPPSIGFNGFLLSAEIQCSERTTICKQVNTVWAEVQRNTKPTVVKSKLSEKRTLPKLRERTNLKKQQTWFHLVISWS